MISSDAYSVMVSVAEEGTFRSVLDNFLSGMRGMRSHWIRQLVPLLQKGRKAGGSFHMSVFACSSDVLNYFRES